MVPMVPSLINSRLILILISLLLLSFSYSVVPALYIPFQIKVLVTFRHSMYLFSFALHLKMYTDTEVITTIDCIVGYKPARRAWTKRRWPPGTVVEKMIRDIVVEDMGGLRGGGS